MFFRERNKRVGAVQERKERKIKKDKLENLVKAKWLTEAYLNRLSSLRLAAEETRFRECVLNLAASIDAHACWICFRVLENKNRSICNSCQTEKKRK